MKENQGLSEKEVEESRLKYGENKISEYKRKSFIKGFLGNLNDPIIRVLIVALLINMIFMFPNINWIESGGLATSILISTLVSTISEYSSENTFERLREESKKQLAVVKRVGGVCEIPASLVVVGDLMLISPGQSIVADGKMLEGEIFLDESALTGESREVRKSAGGSEDSSRILKGSLVVSGSGMAIVERVGEATYYGTVARELKEETRPSPLKNRLTDLARAISRLGYVVAILIAFAYLFNVLVIDSHMEWAQVLAKVKDVKFLLSKLLSALTLAMSIVVVAVPEGLPMMITVVLSSNMKKMTRDNVLVRKLVGIETSGNINLLFTDKTGTLTEGNLKVKGMYTCDGEGFTTLNNMKSSQKLKKYATLCGVYCNGAVHNGQRSIGSDATDRCVLDYFINRKINATVISKEGFDSDKKYSSAIVNCDGEEISLFKGAPERLISSAVSYLSKDGEIKQLNAGIKEHIHKKLRELAMSSYRVVALGFKEKADTSLEKIVLIGLIAIRDKIRKEVPNAIKEVQGAGVGVVMITGDNEDTATAIAGECGIISATSSRKMVIGGATLAKMTDDEIKEILPRLAVVARALPSDKSRLVRIAQNSGYIVGMTGDGINDASSLKLADVGFAMGSGTEVAKEAGDIVIRDNNFASIVKAILYGRTIFESIRRFIVFQLTMNLGAVGISLIGPFIGIDNPVTITQMLWVNIIMDTLGALAFASEPPLAEYMKKPPKGQNEKIISGEMLRQILLTGTFIVFMCIWFLKSDTLPMLLTRGDERYILSAFFGMFIFTGIFVSFLARTTRINFLAHISKNKSFLVIMALISLVQISFIYFGGDTLRATPLACEDLFTVILISLTVVVFDLLRKIIGKLFFRGKEKSMSIKLGHGGKSKCH